MIVVTTPNGRIGSQVLRQLLDRDERVRVISFTPQNLPSYARHRIEVVAGSLDDPDTLKRGFDGAEAVFWCIPQSSEGNRWDNAHAYHSRFAKAAAHALTGSAVRVVAISAARHGYDDDGGLVSAFKAVEETLNSTGAPIWHLRLGFLMENLFGALHTLANAGAVFFNGPGDLPLPMVCTTDAAAKAVLYLTDRSWDDQGFTAVHGPTHVSFNEMAAILSDVLGKPIRYVQIPGEVLIANLVAAGLPKGFAAVYAQLLTSEALEAYDMEPRTAETTTTTGLRDWAQRALLPAFERAQSQAAGNSRF